MNKRQKKKKMKKEIVKISKIGGKIRKGFQEGMKNMDKAVLEAIKAYKKLERAAEPNIIVTARALARRRRRWN